MTVELLQMISLVSFIVAALLFLLGIALFFLLDIPRVYGDITGRTARKAIEAIRQQNESTGNKAYKPSPVNAARGKLTDKITKSGRLESQTAGLAVSVGTEKFATATLFAQSNETTVLEETANETTLLESASNETTVLMSSLPQANNETTMLVSEEGQVTVPEAGEFTVNVEMAFTGSAEIIE